MILSIIEELEEKRSSYKLDEYTLNYVIDLLKKKFNIGECYCTKCNNVIKYNEKDLFIVYGEQFIKCPLCGNKIKREVSD